ncbi:TonB-dependent receptor [Brevundimonas variabilis]|uniref:Iron complex outermembrane receptor protein n=1 Tax=Brevundimonas variabilis TaxID=74312 RepID=A0A7W9CJT9_9CAUL|nr:TonB-dependent receptor [Brevundimonas variabilis]MBB5747008.1 iron complex outermembrane receptor protein [Brevundimonas variabilis]
MRVVTGALLALLTSTSAYAQTGVPADTQEPTTVDDIIVTASRREQSLQDVSIAVTALGEERLNNAQVNNLSDLQTIVPSVNFGNDFNQAKIFIRGVGANTSTTGSSTGVALHVDGAYVARAEAQLTSLFDVQRVEVLRGPQGTLYGRNAVGGSINVITAKPSDVMEGYGRLTIGSYNALNTEVAIGGPITDGIQFRIAGKTEARDGFGENPFTGADVDDLNRRMFRGQLNFDFTPDVSLLLSGEYFRQDDSSGAIHYLRASFPGVARLPAFGVGGYATDPRDLASEIQPGTSTESYAFTSTFRANVSENLSFTNITNFRSFESSLFQDLDLSAVVSAFTVNGFNSTVQERRIDSEQFSTELQMNYDTDFVNLVLGGYYFEEQQNPIDNVGFGRSTGLPGTPAILARDGIPLDVAYSFCGYGPGDTTGGSAIQTPKRVCVSSDLQTEATALFGQATFNLGTLSEQLSGLSVKVGGRYSRETVTTDNAGYIIRYSATAPLQALPTLYSPRGSTLTERTFEDFTPELGLQWAVNPDVLLYYTYSEGFKAGSGENAFQSRTIVDPEEITNHEVGVKATLLDQRLTLNMAAYSYELEGLQLNKTITGGPAGFTTIFQNAARTSASGFEADFFARPIDTVRVSGGLSWTDAQFDDYITVDPLAPQNVAGGPAYNPVTNPSPTAFGAPGGGNLQLAGNRVRNTPEWAWSLHGEVDLPFVLPMDGQLTLMGDLSYKSQIFFSEFAREIESSDAYTMADASLVYESGDGAITAQLWAKNIGDEDVRASTFAVSTGRLIGVTYLPPRTYGFSVGYRF